MPPDHDPFGARYADDIERHLVRENDWSNSDVLLCIGFLTCSQAKIFAFIEEVVHPIQRVENEQARLVSALNPILQRDQYRLARAGTVSGYPVFRVTGTGLPDGHPADALISRALSSFDEAGVHSAWEKALSRRSVDPEGAITAAKTLLETVCKHILDEVSESYQDSDDLPHLYKRAATHLNLAPIQHTEETFKVILGSCEQIVGRLSSIRNKLGDAHGKGRKGFKPAPRHAELAVNLAGTVAMFLVSTWNTRKTERQLNKTELA
jgi:hypothetical protein